MAQNINSKKWLSFKKPVLQSVMDSNYKSVGDSSPPKGLHKK